MKSTRLPWLMPSPTLCRTRPSPQEVEHATRLLAAYDESSAAGLAAIDFEGQMVDEPLAAQARRVLSLANGAG